MNILNEKTAFFNDDDNVNEMNFYINAKKHQ